MSDTIALAGTSTVVGVKAFKTVTKMVVPARAAASDAVEIGTGNLIGLNVALSDNFVLVTIFNGTRVAADTVVVVTDPSVLSHNTIGTYGTPDGAKGLRVMVGVS